MTIARSRMTAGVPTGDVVEAAEDRAARRGGKKGRACWLATRVAAAGTGSPHGSAGGRRNVPGQPGATEHHGDRLAPEKPYGPAVADHRERHRRVRRWLRRARSAVGRMTGGCLALGAAGCDRGGRPDHGDPASQGSHSAWTQRAAGRFRGEDTAERRHGGLRARALLYPGPRAATGLASHADRPGLQRCLTDSPRNEGAGYRFVRRSAGQDGGHPCAIAEHQNSTCQPVQPSA